MEPLQNKITMEPVCFTCQHFKDDGSFTCSAFPEGIPDEILFGENDHEEPLPDQDNDIVYEEVAS